MISDTHGDLHTTKKALESQPTAEVIIHCGDSRDELDYIERTVRNKAVIAVKGNCDFAPFPIISTACIFSIPVIAAATARPAPISTSPTRAIS